MNDFLVMNKISPTLNERLNIINPNNNISLLVKLEKEYKHNSKSILRTIDNILNRNNGVRRSDPGMLRTFSVEMNKKAVDELSKLNSVSSIFENHSLKGLKY